MTRMEQMEEAFVPLGFVMALTVLLHPYTYGPGTLAGKRILITDASSTLGEGMAYEYAKVKTLLTLAASNHSALERIAAHCRELGAVQVEVLAGDVTDPKYQDALIGEAKKTMGGLDHLILNHEAEDGTRVTSANSTGGLNQLMQLHFTSYVALTSKALPMLQASKGHVGVVSSLVGKIPIPGKASHSASRAALMGFFPALRRELYARKTGVSVTSVSLGYVTAEDGTNAVGKHNPFFSQTMPTSVADAAETAIIAVALRKFEISYPFMSQLQYGLYCVFPNYYENFAPIVNKLY